MQHTCPTSIDCLAAIPLYAVPPSQINTCCSIVANTTPNFNFDFASVPQSSMSCDNVNELSNGNNRDARSDDGIGLAAVTAEIKAVLFLKNPAHMKHLESFITEHQARLIPSE